MTKKDQDAELQIQHPDLFRKGYNLIPDW